MKTIAFVCVGNSFKSIVAERLAKELTNDFIFVSGGTNPASKINEDGKKIMEKRGMSMKGYKPHSLHDLPEKIDYLVQMGCGITCPMIKAKNVINFNMDKYPSETLIEKEIIVNILENKIKELCNICYGYKVFEIV
ncbi:MAG: hypothetical protein MJH09_11685 [Cetobacterium sp.]|nr:hypothetical protein [Cetobacterium sp.]